ncbi:MAG: hypothetical protein SGILL_008726, partial [Bacillariaceae sp.]
RDSPPGSVEEQIMDAHRSGNSVHTSTTYGSGKKSEGSCEDKNDLSKKSAPRPSLSSKHELDAGLDAMFEMAASESRKKPDPAASGENVEAIDPDDAAELELVRHLTEPLAKQHMEVSGRSDRSKTKKKGRKKRGASLERMIAKMILQSSTTSGQEEPVPTRSEKRSSDDVTTKDILSDLVKANDSTSAISGHSKETTPWVNTAAKVLQEHSNLVGSTSLTSMEEDPAEAMVEEEEQGANHQQQVPQEPIKESPMDAFGFAVDDGWAAFDDGPAFDTSFFPSDALDANGFPVSIKKEEPADQEERRSGPVDLDDYDSEAEEEELAAELRKEMEEEIARESTTNATLQKKVRQERSAYVASQVAKLETTAEDDDKLRLIEEEIEREQTEERARKQREEERMREEQYRLSREMATTSVDEQEKQEQNLAKELARRIAKEQEWGKLQEMAQELARKQMDEEKYQELERKIKARSEDERPPFTLDEVEVAERDSFSDDDVSSLPTTQSFDSRSLSQFLVKENNIPPVINELQEEMVSHTTPPPVELVSSQEPTESSPDDEASLGTPTEEPGSPSSVVDLDNTRPNEDKPVRSVHAGISGPLAARARYRNTRTVFASRQQQQPTESSSGSPSRPKPTWNPNPPRHYNRSMNGL